MKSKNTLKTTYPHMFPDTAEFDYLQFPFYWIAQLDSLYSLQIEKSLKKVGLDISRWRVGILLRVRQELTISEISNNSLIKISTVTKIVQKMEKEGLVTVHKHKEDGRVRLVKLTSEGKAQVDMITQTTAPMYEQIFAGFSQAEMEVFVQLSQKLFQNLEKYE